MLRRHRFITLAVALAGLPALLGLASCSGGRESASSAVSAPAAPAADGASPAADGAGQELASPVSANDQATAAGRAASASAGPAANPASLAAVQLIRTADLVVQVDQRRPGSARWRSRWAAPSRPR